MGLMRLSDRIYYLPHEEAVDRPMLAYIKGDRYTLAIDAGYSYAHVQSFYQALTEEGLSSPQFTVLTHWHYDHTYGMHAVDGVTIACQATNVALRTQQQLTKVETYFDALKEEDKHFAQEYANQANPTIVLADIAFNSQMFIDLGGVTAEIYHTTAPHSEDCVCVYVPEEGVLFLGDATSEDFFNGGYMDIEKLRTLIAMIEQTPCNYCVLSHCEPLQKEALLAYLQTLL